MPQIVCDLSEKGQRSKVGESTLAWGLPQQATSHDLTAAEGMACMPYHQACRANDEHSAGVQPHYTRSTLDCVK